MPKYPKHVTINVTLFKPVLRDVSLVEGGGASGDEDEVEEEEEEDVVEVEEEAVGEDEEGEDEAVNEESEAEGHGDSSGWQAGVVSRRSVCVLASFTGEE